MFHFNVIKSRENLLFYRFKNSLLPLKPQNTFRGPVCSERPPAGVFLDTSNWEGLDVPSGLGMPQDSQEEPRDVWDGLLSRRRPRPGLTPFVQGL